MQTMLLGKCTYLQQTDLNRQTSRTNRILLTEWSTKGPFFSLDLYRPPCPQWCVHSRKSRTNRLNRMMLTKSVGVSAVTVPSGSFWLGSHRDPTKETEHDRSSQIFSPWVSYEANKRILCDSITGKFCVTCQLRPQMQRAPQCDWKTPISPSGPQNGKMRPASFYILHCNQKQMRNNIGTLSTSQKLIKMWTIWPTQSGSLGHFGAGKAWTVHISTTKRRTTKIQLSLLI